MAGKRRPGTELNHDNWNDEEEPEEKGEFRMASEQELSRRVIKTAKRRGPTDGKSSTTSAMSSVFGGFSGFTTPAATGGSGFGSAASTGGSAAAKAPSSIFAFLSQDQKKDTPTTNGTSGAKDQTDSSSTSTSTSTTTTTSDNSNPDKEYHQKLKALNESVLQWLKQHMDKDPICILTPIFKDYEKHLQEIQAKTGPKTSAFGGPATTFGSVPAVSAAKPPATTPAVAAPTSTPASGFGGFSFGSASSATSSTPAAAPKISFGSGSTTATTPFGTTNPLVPASTTGFSFGAAKPFSFGSTAPTTTAEPKKDGGEDNEDDEDQPPKVEFKPVVEEDSVYDKRCKVFFKVDGNFQDRGIGTIFVKPVKDTEKHQLIVRADTSLGNILVNLMLSKGLPVKKMGKNNVMLVCIPNTDFDKPTTVLFKVKTEDDADEVVEKLNDFIEG